MSLITRRRTVEPEPRRPTEERSTTADILQIIRNSMVGTGTSASMESAASSSVALSHPIVYRSVSKISGIVAQFPWDAFEGRSEVDPEPNLLASPSPGVLRCSAWKRSASTSMLLGGGAYAFITERRGPRGVVVERIDLLSPDRVDWTPQTGWTVDNKQVEEWPAGPFWQVPYLTIPGSPKGVNPLEYARRTTFAGLAAAEFGSNFFRDGGHPTAIIAPETDPGKDAAEALKARVMESVRGTNRGPIVLPQSVKWTQMQINPDDSQFIESMKFSAIELAGFFGLMPEHVGLPVEGSGIQYSNRENRQQDLLQDAVMPVIMPLEEALSELLPAGQVVKFNTAGLLRSDLKARYETYEIAARIEQNTGKPVLTVDEMRQLEDRLPTAPVDEQSSRAAARDLAEIVQKIYLGVGVVITAEEARQIVNAAGGQLPPGFTPGGGTP